MPRVFRTSGRTDFDDRRVGRPATVVRVFGNFWLRMRARVRLGALPTVIMRISRTIAIPLVAVAVVPGQARAVLAVLDYIHGAVAVAIWWPRHGRRNEGRLYGGIDAIIISAVGGADVLQLSARGHPGLVDPLPICAVPVPAALDPQGVGALKGDGSAGGELAAGRSGDNAGM
jgi:hypothetical protein